MSQRPFDIMRWESSAPPNLEILTRLMVREGLEPAPVELAPQVQTAEMKFEHAMVRVLVSGTVQVAFPGYGVIQLDPGDILEVNPGVLHDIVVSSGHPALLLESPRPN